METVEVVNSINKVATDEGLALVACITGEDFISIVSVTEVKIDSFSLLESRRAADDYRQGQYGAQEGGHSYGQGNQPHGQPQAPQAPQQGDVNVSQSDMPW